MTTQLFSNQSHAQAPNLPGLEIEPYHMLPEDVECVEGYFQNNYARICLDCLKKASDHRSARHFIACLFAIVHKNIDNPNFSIENMYSNTLMSKSQFYRKVNEYLHLTPHEFRLELRMHLAKYLLLTTDKKIYLIAAQCGFRDQSYFVKVFSKFYGKSPREFKSSHKNINLVAIGMQG